MLRTKEVLIEPIKINAPFLDENGVIQEDEDGNPVIAKKEIRTRDAGKRFQITEMTAEQAEWFAFRVMNAAVSNNSAILATPSMWHLALKGDFFISMANIPPEIARILLDELLACVKIIMPGGAMRELLPGDIQDAPTLTRLRKMVWDFHVNFFKGGEA